MRRSLVPVAVLGLLATARADTRVDAVPEVATVSRGRTRVVVRADVPRARQREMVQLVDQVVADVERRFLVAKGDPHPAITLCLFADAKRYRDVAVTFGEPIPSDMGFYMPGVRIGLANVGISVGNLRHELVHPLVDDDFPKIPAWLNEGLGALYGTARWRAGKFEFLVNYRLRDLQRALKAAALPALADLATTTFVDVHGPRAGMYYAYGRYLLLYLEQRGQLSAFYAEMRAAGGDTRKHAAIMARYIDEPAFRRWATALRF